VTIGVEGRKVGLPADGDAGPAIDGAGRRSERQLVLFRRWLVDHWGPIAPHGLATVGLYLIFTLLARLISFGRVERSTLLYLVVALAAVLFIAMIVILVWTLWRALRDTASLTAAGGWRPILLAALGAGLCLLTLPRLFSKDVLSYLVYGRAFGAYRLNPYITTPNNMQFDFNFRLIDWHDAVSVYGPAWTLLCTALYKVVAPLAASNIWGYIVSFRALGLVFHLGNAALIWFILGRLRPRDQVAGTIFYAWNPLVLIEFAGNGHNDAALVFFLLGAIAALVATQRRPWLVALCLALSVLTKFITLLVIPGYLLLLWRTTSEDYGRWITSAWPRLRRFLPGGAVARRGSVPGAVADDASPARRRINWRLFRARVLALGEAGVVGLAAFVILWAPFAAALRHPLFLFDSSAASKYDNSLLQLVYWSLRGLFSAVLPQAESHEIANVLVMTAGRLAFLAIWLLLTWRSRDTTSWLRGAVWILFGSLVLATPWFWPWYVTWLVAVAPLVGGRRATAATLTFSASVLVLYVMWGNQLPFDRGSVYPVHNFVAFGLPLLVLWMQLRRGGALGEPVYAQGRGDTRPGSWGVRSRAEVRIRGIRPRTARAPRPATHE
jgi:hypothetical protein